MMKYVKQIVSAVLLTVALFMGTVLVTAGEIGGDLSDWSLESVKLEHLGVSFAFSGFLPAQEARAILSSSSDIPEEEWTEIVIDFTIEDGQKEYDLLLPEGSYLKGGESYWLEIQGQNGEETRERAKVECGFSAELYYEYELTEIEYVSDCEITRATAEINSVEYEGTISDDRIVISYPSPGNATGVTVNIWDEYGCVRTYTGRTQLPMTFGKVNLYAFPDGVRFTRDIGIVKFDPDERMAVQAGEKIYYSEYGYTAEWGGEISRVAYPLQKAGTRITAWMEDKSGNITLKKKFTVQSCEFYRGTDEKAYPEMMTGQIEKGRLEQTPTKVRVRIGGKSYESRVDQYRRYTIRYPEQQEGAKLTYDYLDDHGCCLTQTIYVCNRFLVDYKNDYDIARGMLEITATSFCAESDGDVRVCVKIGNNVYKGSFETFERGGDSCVSVNFPAQKPGTVITAWYEDKNTVKTAKKNFKIPAPAQIQLVIREFTTQYIMFEPYFYIIQSGKKVREDIESVCGYFNGKKCKAKQDDSELYTIKYSAKVGDMIKIVILDWRDRKYETSCKVPLPVPEVYVNRVESGSGKVTGHTDIEGRMAVTVKAGKKKYKATSKKDGSFSVKIKPQKAGTKITVTVKTKDGATGKESVKVKQAKGNISFSKIIYRDSRTITCKVTGAYKGDIVTAKVGNKTYKKKLKSEKRSQKVTFSIHPASAGTKVQVTYTDKFKKFKNVASAVVYYGNAIYVGMSSKDACLTTWGKPRRKNYYGGRWEQWVFISGRSTLYVYVQGGTVVYLQRIN